MGIYTEAIQKLYVAYFNRPADAAGLAYWENIVTNAKGSTTAISAAFATSAEYKATYAGMDEYHVVAQVYQNLFGRAPELSGLNFWGQALINKQMTVDNVVTMIAAGAQGTDLAAYNSKVSAATAFTAALDTSDKVLAYSGDKANGVAKSFLASVVDATTLANAISTGTLGKVISDVVAAAPQQVGSTFSLTAGLDNLLGTANNDVFNVLAINPTTGAAANNLSAFDVIDGSAGKDTLNIEVAAGKDATNATINLNSTQGATVTNVETINLSQGSADATLLAASTIDASKFVGATAINQIGQATAISNLGATTTAGFQGITAGALSVTAAGAAANVAFTNVSDAVTSLTVGGTKLASVSVSGNRVDTAADGMSMLTVAVTAGKDVQSLAVSSNQKTTLTVTEDKASAKHVTTIDASASTGAVTFAGTSQVWDTATSAYVAQKNVLNYMGGSGVDTVTISAATSAATASAAAVNASISTGAGNDVIVVSTTGTGLTTVDAGAGDDGITVNKVNGALVSVTGGDGNDTITITPASASDALQTTDVIDGGAGTDVIQLAGAASRIADDFIVFNKLLKNFETIKFSTAEGTTTALDASKLAANYTTIDLASTSKVAGVASQALIANGDLTATASGYDGSDSTAIVYAGNLNVTEKVTGSVTANADVLTLTVKAASSANVTGTLLGDVQTANITVTNTVNSSTSPTIDRLASVTVDTGAVGGDAHLKSLVLSGTGSANVTNAAATALTSVDASALGGTLAVAGTTTAGLTYSSLNTKAETIKLGSGIDHITLGASTYGKVDTVTGLNLVLATGGTTLDAAKSDTLAVTGVATTVKAFANTQTDLDLALKDAAVSSKGNDLVFVLNGDTYIYHDGGTADVVDAADILVKVTGVTDLNAVIVALGGTPA